MAATTMKIFHDTFDDCWMWVNDQDENNELSPRFDEYAYAMKWLIAIADEFHKDELEELAQLNEGKRVILPKNKEHAESMVRIGMSYLDTQYGQDNPRTQG